jgi:outer membrane murein-binding lipoprotein Lpp
MSDMMKITITLLVLSTGFCISTIVLAFAWRRARNEKLTRIATDLEAIGARVDRLGTAVDTIAVEVERIGEAERFAAKALAASGRASPEGRVITPH